MDGTRDGVRPELSIVKDDTGSDTDMSYMVIRDGISDNKWGMTFFIAPADYPIVNNDNYMDTDDNNAGNNGQDSNSSSNNGPGGNDSNCSSGAGILSLIALFAVKRREGR